MTDMRRLGHVFTHFRDVDEPAEIPDAVHEDASASVGMPRGSDHPSRPCPFCGKFKVRLTRHIRAVRKNEQQVQQIKKGVKKQRAALKLFKRRGIMD